MGAFVWRIATNGYEWQRVGSPEAQYYFEFQEQRGPSDEWKILMPTGREFKTYEPLTEFTGLFQTFGMTATTFEGIRTFANSYGHLGQGESWAVDVDCGPSDSGHATTGKMELDGVVQSYEGWKTAITRMREALNRWDITRHTHSSVAAKRDLSAIINENLSQLSPRFEFRKSPSREPVLHLVPSTLLGAMWLQLAQAIAEEKKYRACESCRRWFELSPDLNRSTRIYCTEACRSRAYRARIQHAHKLQIEGKSIRQIARILKSNNGQIEKWLSVPKEKHS